MINRNQSTLCHTPGETFVPTLVRSTAQHRAERHTKTTVVLRPIWTDCRYQLATALQAYAQTQEATPNTRAGGARKPRARAPMRLPLVCISWEQCIPTTAQTLTVSCGPSISPAGGFLLEHS